ncbi:hypothetical protein BDZ45DRAFT_804985 [Acephala macrosclerotiorum]|nr:hypothetical protein BDZ45DRAFT_804985 [Acephala macrosclerotiorum]
MKRKDVADELAEEQAAGKKRVAEDNPTTQGFGTTKALTGGFSGLQGLKPCSLITLCRNLRTPEVSRLEYEGQGSLNSLDFIEHETEAQDVRSHDRGGEAQNSSEATGGNEPFEGSEETGNGEESTDESSHSIRELDWHGDDTESPNPYSWKD